MRKIVNPVVFCLLSLLALLGEARSDVVDGGRIMDQPMAENLCALTFDDGPSQFTPALLDMLEEYGIPATFFMLGCQASRFPDIVRRISESGHEIGNHSWSHPNLKTLSTEKQVEQISATDSLLRSLGGVPLYMRPPYGSFDERTEKIANELGITLILWSMDSHDWRRLPEDYAKVLSTRGTVYEDGELRGIFLFHDIHKKTVEDFPRIVDNLRKGGCDRFVTVSDYLAGILDPEPALAMKRHPATNIGETHNPKIRKAHAAGSAPVPFARCSEPWQPAMELEEAQASADAFSSTAVSTQ